MHEETAQGIGNMPFQIIRGYQIKDIIPHKLADEYGKDNQDHAQIVFDTGSKQHEICAQNQKDTHIIPTAAMQKIIFERAKDHLIAGQIHQVLNNSTSPGTQEFAWGGQSEI